MVWQDDNKNSTFTGMSDQSRDVSGPALPSMPSGLLKRIRSRIASHARVPDVSPETSRATIQDALENPDWSVRVAALQTTHLASEDVPLDLLAHAMQDEHEAVRAAAARALGKVQAHAPLGHLLLALHDTSWQVRAAAAQTLGKLGKRVPIGTLVRLLADEDEAVRAAATGALGEIGEPAAIQPLLFALHDPAWHVREMAVLALGRFGEQAPADKLAEAWHDTDSQVREAVEALHETQPRLFRSILAARSRLRLPTIIREIQPTSVINEQKRAPDIQNVPSSLFNLHKLFSFWSPQHYPRTGSLRTLRLGLNYGWCFILGYLIGCFWYLLQSAQQGSSLRFDTALTIFTMTSLPLHTGMPGWLHPLIALTFLLLLLGAIWSSLDVWLEQRVLNQRHNNKILTDPASGISPDYTLILSGATARQNRARRVLFIGLVMVILLGNAAAWSLLLQHPWNGQAATETHATRNPFRSYPVRNGLITLAWSPDSTRIVTGGTDGVVQIRKALSGEVLFNHVQPQMIFAVAWSPNGKYIASGSSDGSVQVWESASGKPLALYTQHRSSVIDLAWSPDSTRLISSAQDGTVQIWHALSGEQLAVYTGSEHDAASVTWSPDGRYIAAIGQNDTLWIRQVENGILVRQRKVDTPSHSLTETIGQTLAWSPRYSSTTLAYSDHDGNVQLFNTSNGTIVATYDDQGPIEKKTSAEKSKTYSKTYNVTENVSWSPDGTRLAMARRDRSIEVHAIENGEVLFRCLGHSYYLSGIAWSPDGNYIAASSWNDPTLLIWKAT